MRPGDAVLQHYLAPLQPWLRADDVLELVVNRPGEVGVERPGGWSWHEVPELDARWLRPLAVAAAAQTAQDISEAQPLCSTVLPDGARAQLVLPPAAEHLSLTIRRPSRRTLALADFAAAGLFEEVRPAGRPADLEGRLLALREAGDWPGFFAAAVAGRRNILVSGATGSGKTTFAKALAAFIPPDERLVTIEDTRELVLPQRNVVHLLYAKDGQGLAQIGPWQLLECALRMRPDRILLQELRDGSAFTYLRTAGAGHPGSITTIHAESPALAFEQLVLLARESAAGRGLAREDIRGLLLQLVDVVVQMRRVDGRFRVAEVWYEPQRKRTLAA